MKDYGFEVMHVGVNAEDDKEALALAELLGKMFSLQITETPISVFVSDGIEVMKGNGRGTKGHIAIGTTDIAGAWKYLEDMGYTFDESSIAYFEDGSMKLIYLKEEIGGFAIHLVKK